MLKITSKVERIKTDGLLCKQLVALFNSNRCRWKHHAAAFRFLRTPAAAEVRLLHCQHCILAS